MLGMWHPVAPAWGIKGPKPDAIAEVLILKPPASKIWRRGPETDHNYLHGSRCPLPKA
jgi:hypothetical protein